MAASTKAKPPTSRSPITITAIFSTRTWRGVNTVPGNGVLSGSLAVAIVLRPHVDRTQTALERLTAEADQSHAGQRLDPFLSMRLPSLSWTRVQALIKGGHASLSGATIEDVTYRVKPGDRFALELPPPVPATLGPEEIPLNVLYEDDALIVIDKPAGLVVHPGAGQPDRHAGQCADRPLRRRASPASAGWRGPASSIASTRIRAG